MGRILSIWLPQLPLDRLIRRADPRINGAFAVTQEIKNAVRITYLTSNALKAGLTAGLSIPDARAICPDLLTEPSDPVRETALLKALWRWADILSPRVALDPPDGLVLDISGCAHLFGGETAMAAHARQRLTDLQVTPRIGIADTKGAARALARFGRAEISCAETGKTRASLQSLPIAALNISDAIIADLASSGLKTIGQLYDIKSSELARRFGLDVINALETSIGVKPDPVSPNIADPVYAARMTLPDPIGYLSDIENVLIRLATSVCKRLQKEQKGARQFHLTVRCVDTGDHKLTVGFTRPCFETGPILQQFTRPLDALKIEFGADWFRLVAANIEPVRPRQLGLGNKDQDTDNIEQVISTLGNRLGFDHVRRFQSGDSHLPEREFRQIPIVAQTNAEPWPLAPRARPIRLYRRPERLRTLEAGRPPRRFEWRRKPYQTKTAKGPERLTPEWWFEGDLRLRDYWTVQTIDGPRLWLLTYPGSKTPDWFVAGRFP